MSELKEFSSEEMKGCPSFAVNEDHRFFYLKNKDVWCVDIEMDFMFIPHSFKCNPIDRMNAIARHLFELMPKSKSISQYFDQPAFLKFDDLSETKLSINPFLHTDRTEITREELGL